MSRLRSRLPTALAVALRVITLAGPASLGAQGDLGAFERGMRAYAAGRWAEAYADLRGVHEALPQHPGVA